MTLEELLASLLRVFEGLRLVAYQDTGGVWTIGFGHTGIDVHAGMTITYSQAIEFIRQDSKNLINFVQHLPILEAAAFASFGYDCGIGALTKVCSSGANPDDLLSYNHDRKGNILPGLVARRQLECNLIKVSRQSNA